MTWAAKTDPNETSEHLTERMLADPDVSAAKQRARRLLSGFLGMGIGAGAGEPDLFEKIFEVAGHAGVVYGTEITSRGNRPPLVAGGAVISLPDDDLADWFLARLEGALTDQKSIATPMIIGEVPMSTVEAVGDSPRWTWGRYQNYICIFAGEDEAQKCLDRIGGIRRNG